MKKLNIELLIILIVGVVLTLTVSKLLTGKSSQDTGMTNVVYSSVQAPLSNSSDRVAVQMQSSARRSIAPSGYSAPASASYSSTPQASVMQTSVHLTSEAKTTVIAPGLSQGGTQTYSQSAGKRSNNTPAPSAGISMAMPIASPFTADAPRVIAKSGDIAPFGMQGPRKGPGIVGDADKPEDTDVPHDDSPLNGGIWFLLLLALAVALRTYIKTRKAIG